MAIPVLKLNLAPAPTFWRQRHELVGFLALSAGLLILALSAGISVAKVVQASREGKRLVNISSKSQRVAREQAQVLDALHQVDPAERAPRYRLAERIFQERALPWSRLTCELERNLGQDVRLKSISRVRGSDGTVLLKFRGEAKARKAEAAFIEALQGNATFRQVVLEREGERQGGGIDFDAMLPVAAAPPPFTTLPVLPPKKVDQFGKPLDPSAKIIRQISGGTKGATPVRQAGLPVPAPLPPAAAPLKPKAPEEDAEARRRRLEKERLDREKGEGPRRPGMSLRERYRMPTPAEMEEETKRRRGIRPEKEGNAPVDPEAPPMSTGRRPGGQP